MLMVKLKLRYCYNYIKLVNDKTKIKLLLQLHSNIELMTEHDLRLDMCFPYSANSLDEWGRRLARQFKDKIEECKQKLYRLQSSD